MRIVFVPQYPSKLRYQEWWFTELPKQFRQRGFEVKVLGENFTSSHTRSLSDMFSPIEEAIEFEATQIQEYVNMDVKANDILFWSDISFPGLFGHVLFHKRPAKMFGFCHATSLNIYDYYQPVRKFKYPIEESICQMFDTIFVGSEYHKDKLGWDNLKVTYLPIQPAKPITSDVPKTIDIMSASRPSKQKVDSELEDYVEEKLNVKIERPVSESWSEYHMNLNAAKVLLITAHEDTFGYQIVDAVQNNCIPIARNGLAYPELLPRRYLYNDKVELVNSIDQIINRDRITPVPKLICWEQMNKFYDVICEEMRRA